MPPAALRTFPWEGFTLYGSDDDVGAVLRQAGFTPLEFRIFGGLAIPTAGSPWPRPRQAIRPSHAAGQLAAARTVTPE